MFARQALRPVTLLTASVRQYSSSAESGARWWHSTPVRYGLYGVGSLGVASLLIDNWRLRRHANAMEQIANEALVYSGERDPSPKVFTGGEQGFVPLTLESVADVNHNTKRFKFKFDDAKAVSGLSYCSALVARHQGPESTKPVMRAYTPISHEGGKGSLELMIKKYPTGPMSSHIHSMKPGDTLEFKGPIPKYAWSTNKHEHVALIAGGTGITPMYQLCRAILENPFDKTKVTLVYGNISKDDILLRDELRQLEQFTGGRFRMYHVLEKPPKHWPQGTGYITKEMLSSILPKPERGDDIKIFVCGPPPMYKAISGTKKSPSDQGELDGFLKELGYSKDQVYKF